MTKKDVGEEIRKLRKEKKMTLDALSSEAGIGMVYLGEIERGKKMPSLTTFVNIVNALDVSADLALCREVNAGKSYVINEITKKLENLTPKQRKTALDILNAYFKNVLDEE